MGTNGLSMGVIGAGRIGKVHAESVARRVPGARLAGVADIDLAAARSLAGQLNVPRATADYRELLRDASLEAVVICSATDTHAQIIGEAAAAGKHIFCEKPIDYDLGRIARALDAVDRAGVRFQVGFNRRFDPGFAKARELVAAGKVGALHMVRITSRDPAPPPLEYVRVSGGIFLDMTIHDFDMVRFLSGSEAEEIYTMGATLVDPEIGRAGDVDTCVVVMRLRNGALATIDNSRKAVYGYDQRVEVFGSAGMVTVANRTPENHIHFAADGVHSSTPLYFFLERYLDAYVAEMREFVRCVESGSTPPVTGRDGLAPVIMGLAATKSLKEGRPVKLDEIG
ncbi:MAG TPA: inositol 2-dehydrogenase [Candidatus Methylomirabilis sp.]|nr:inositol 2-dehydrogenase [Candidatus Methylomirabilis sp.]